MAVAQITVHSWPLPPPRAVTFSSAIVNSRICFPSSSSVLSNRRNLWLQTRRRSTPFGTIIKCAVREIDEIQFPDVVLKSDRPVLVEFVATWCGPCRLVAPAVQSLAQEYQDKLLVVKIDHDANPRLIEDYKVYGLPTLIVFQNGQEVPESRREGAITKAKLKEYVDKHLEYASSV